MNKCAVSCLHSLLAATLIPLCPCGLSATCFAHCPMPGMHAHTLRLGLNVLFQAEHETCCVDAPHTHSPPWHATKVQAGLVCTTCRGSCVCVNGVVAPGSTLPAGLGVGPNGCSLEQLQDATKLRNLCTVAFPGPPLWLQLLVGYPLLLLAHLVSVGPIAVLLLVALPAAAQYVEVGCCHWPRYIGFNCKSFRVSDSSWFIADRSLCCCTRACCDY